MDVHRENRKNSLLLLQADTRLVKIEEMLHQVAATVIRLLGLTVIHPAPALVLVVVPKNIILLVIDAIVHAHVLLDPRPDSLLRQNNQEETPTRHSAEISSITKESRIS